MNRELIIENSRKFLGCPWRRSGRLPETGLDCAGLVVCVAQELGYPIRDVKNYQLAGDGRIREYFLRSFEEISSTSLRLPGDIGLFRFDRTGPAVHAAIFTGYSRIVHVHIRIRRVVEHDLTPIWEKRLCHVMKFRGAEPWQPSPSQ